jgi:hypothetical protein
MDFITDLLLYKERGNIQIHDSILIVIDRYFKFAKYIITRKDLIAKGLVIFII